MAAAATGGITGGTTSGVTYLGMEAASSDPPAIAAARSRGIAVLPGRSEEAPAAAPALSNSRLVIMAYLLDQPRRDDARSALNHSYARRSGSSRGIPRARTGGQEALGPSRPRISASRCPSRS